MVNRIVEKLTSGRWLLTLAAIYVWIHGTISGLLSAEFSGGLLVLVTKEYFDRKDRPTQKEEGTTDEAPKGDGTNA